MKTFNEYKETGFLNEGKIEFDKLRFTVSSHFDRQGLVVSFIPDSKTLKLPKNTQVEAIQAQLGRIFPKLSKSLWFESGHDSAGITFRLDSFGFAEYITKEINKMN
jgi:hypothetical protein